MRVTLTFIIVCFLGVVVAAPSSEADDGKERRAAAHKVLGKELFLAGEFAGCAKEYKASHALVPEPNKLFNAGLCYEKHGNLEAALESYRAYVVSAPSGDLAGEAKTRVELLELKMKAASQQEVQTEETELAPTDSERGMSGRRITALALSGIGTIGLGVSLISGFKARSDWNRAEELCPTTMPCSSMEGVSLSRDADSAATMASLSAGVSVVVLAGAAYLWFSDSNSADKEKLVFLPTTSGGEISYVVAF